MSAKIQTPRKALNPAFLKQKPVRADIEKFKKQLLNAFDNYDKDESEENHKTLIRDFLNYGLGFREKYAINTKGKNDWVIHNGPNQKKDSVGVIIEAKRAKNKSEMVTAENLNGKAMQELLLYYLRERFDEKEPNINLKHLIITDFDTWLIFDAREFEKHFAKNKKLVSAYKAHRDDKTANSATSAFYNDIAPEFINEAAESIELTSFNLRTYETYLRTEVTDGAQLSTEEAEDQNRLIALYKILSPVHLLKESFANDSNKLDHGFYSELLHIIGFEEVKNKGQKIIRRKKEKDRNKASLFEAAVHKLEHSGRLFDIPDLGRYGSAADEQAEEIGRQSVIVWINRILFLKLLESQLIAYHRRENKPDKYRFLNIKKIANFQALEALFFEVLAIKTAEREEPLKSKFAAVPYLNSSLFDSAYLEKNGVFISQLNSSEKLPVIKKSVLGQKDGSLPVLEYLFRFLDAYDFSSEGSEAISEDRKTLINAAVLGLVFEKINGYKDGSFYTPGFITMYMSRETLRRAVVQKFNDTKGWNCKDFTDLHNKIDDIKEADQIINSLKICDPAVGSGHFLVSVLNELIAIKYELGLLCDKDGRRIKDFAVKVDNDELYIVDSDDGTLFEYNPKNEEFRPDAGNFIPRKKDVDRQMSFWGGY